jgi:hypothetical protein
MTKPIYRITEPGDEEGLLRVWSLAYGGDVDCAKRYFEGYYQPGDGVTAQVGDELCSAIYLIDGFRLHIPGRDPYRCSYLYALGTPDMYRGKGYGGKTIWKSGVVGYDRGADYVCFLPASPSLYRWYEGILGTRTVFYRREFSVSSSEAPAQGEISPIEPEEYDKLRETLLEHTPHAQPPQKAIAMQRDYCALYGGGLFRITLGDHTGLCAVDREGDALTFRELLFPWDGVGAAQAVLSGLGGKTALVRTPVFCHEDLGQVVEDNVLVPGGVSFPKTELLPYWGLSMD